MIEIGQVNQLIVSRETSSGYYLKNPDTNEEVFMPPSLAPIKVKVSEEMEVFVYLDTNGSMIATSQIPYAVVGEYALLQATNVQDFGAFFEWGIEKDLLVPGNEQKFKVRDDEEHLVRICLEEDTERVYGTTKLGKYIESSNFDIAEKDIVDIVPVQQSDLGFRVIINRKFIGMIYANEIFSDVLINEKYQGVVKKIREDGLVDCALQVQGIKNLDNAKDIVFDYLERNGGKSSLHDKSSPEEIKYELGMSKKSFKSAIGMLYREKKILISKTGIEITKD